MMWSQQSQGAPRMIVQALTGVQVHANNFGYKNFFKEENIQVLNLKMFR